MNFDGMELISVSGVDVVSHKEHWISYSMRMHSTLPFNDEMYLSIKKSMNVKPSDLLILFQKCDYNGGNLEFSYFGLVAQKQCSEDISTIIEVGKKHSEVFLFNEQVQIGSVVKIKGMETSEFLKMYFEINSSLPNVDLLTH